MQQFKYEAIAEKINELIESGVYPKGSKLPAHRHLAKELKTTAVTVSKAYQLLVEQRKIKSYVGRGSYVLAERLENVISSKNEEVYNFSILQPCFSKSFAEFHRELNKSVQLLESSTELHQYTENSGLQKHREAGAVWCQNYGLDISECENGKSIILTNGAQHALTSIIQLYTKEGDLIAVEAQTYPGVLAICKYLRRRVVPIAMDKQGMLPDALETQCHIDKPSLVVVIPAEQNPTTVTMLNERRSKIAGVIQQNNLWLIEDDIYAFLNVAKLTPITNLVPERSFYITSVSKAISPGLRCGYLKTPLD